MTRRIALVGVVVAVALFTGLVWRYERRHPTHLHRMERAVAVVDDAPAGVIRFGPARSPLPWWVGPAVAGLFLSVWGTVQWRTGREARVDDPGAIEERPSGHSPAEVAWLLRFGRVRPADLAATIVSVQDGASDRPHERVVAALVGQAAGPEGLEAAIDRDPDAWRSLWEPFVAAVEEAGEQSGLVDRQADSGAVAGGVFVSVLVLVAGVAGLAASHPAWAACVVAGAVGAVASPDLARRSHAGADLAVRWRAYGRHLAGGGDDPAFAIVLCGTRPREVTTVLAWQSAYRAAITRPRARHP